MKSTMSVAQSAFVGTVLDVSGAVTMNSTLSLAQSAFVGTFLDVSGAVTMHSTLDVSGEVTMQSLSVAGICVTYDDQTNTSLLKLNNHYTIESVPPLFDAFAETRMMRFTDVDFPNIAINNYIGKIVKIVDFTNTCVMMCDENDANHVGCIIEFVDEMTTIRTNGFNVKYYREDSTDNSVLVNTGSICRLQASGVISIGDVLECAGLGVVRRQISHTLVNTSIGIALENVPISSTELIYCKRF
jgi:hypothetical protein